MNANTITQAMSAMDIASNCIGETPNQLQKNKVKNSSIHWSFFAVVGIGFAGVITSVASTILFNFGLTLIGAGISGFGCLVGAYFIHQFSQFRALESYVNALADRIKQLANQVIILKETKNDLCTVSTKLNRCASTQKEIYAQNTHDMKVHTEEIDRLTKKITVQEENLNEWQAVCQTIKGSKEEIEVQYKVLLQEKSIMQEDIKRLTEQVHSLKELQSQFQTGTQSLERVSNQLEHGQNQIGLHKRELSNQLETMSQFTVLLADQHHRTKESLSNITDSQRKIDSTVSKIREINNDLGIESNRTEQTLNRLSVLLELTDEPDESNEPRFIQSPISSNSQPGMLPLLGLRSQ
jgi:chromosome segregation ATPase